MPFLSHLFNFAMTILIQNGVFFGHLPEEGRANLVVPWIAEFSPGPSMFPLHGMVPAVVVLNGGGPV